MTLSSLPEHGNTVRHTQGGRGLVILVQLGDKPKALIEWEDLSRTWENFKDLEGPLQ